MFDWFNWFKPKTTKRIAVIARGRNSLTEEDREKIYREVGEWWDTPGRILVLEGLELAVVEVS